MIASATPAAAAGPKSGAAVVVVPLVDDVVLLATWGVVVNSNPSTSNARSSIEVVPFAAVPVPRIPKTALEMPLLGTLIVAV